MDCKDQMGFLLSIERDLCQNKNIFYENTMQKARFETFKIQVIQLPPFVLNI